MNVLRAFNRGLAARPKLVIAVTLALAVVAAIPVSSLPLRTSRLDLVPPDEPSVRAFQSFAKRHGSVHSIFLLVRGTHPANVASAAQDAARILGASPCVRSVLHRVDLDRTAAGLLRALELHRPGAVAPMAGLAAPVLAALMADPTPAGLFDAVAAELGDEETPAPPAAMAQALVRGLSLAVDRITTPAVDSDAWLQTSESWLRDVGLGAPPRGVDAQGNLASSDGRARLLVVTPARSVDAPELAESWLAEADLLLRPVAKASPGVTFDWGGLPAQDAQEHRTVQSDMTRTSALAAALVLGLTWMAFANLWAAVAANLVLALCVHFSLAAAALLVGHLNVISGVFVAVLVGMGIDFGIYIHQLYREALAQTPDPHAALDEALIQGASGVVTGAITPALAFYALTLHQFPAFRELGLIAGTGILIALVLMLVVWPAILRVGGLRLVSPATAEPERLGRILIRLSRGRPVLVLACVAVLMAWLGVSPKAPFDFDVSNLQDASSPAYRVEDFVREAFDISSDFMMVSSPNLAQSRQVAFELAKNPLVKRVDSAGLLLADGPGDPAIPNPLEALRALPAVVTPAPDRAKAAPTATASRLLVGALTRLDDLARIVGDAALTTSVADLKRRLQLLATHLETKGPAADRMVAASATTLAADLTAARVHLNRVIAARPYVTADLPPLLASRYLGTDGSLATYAWAARDLDTEVNARDFVTAVKDAAGSSETAGTPTMVYQMLLLIQKGFAQAALLALGAVVVAVAIDLRQPLWMVFGLVPMLIGTLVTTGTVAASGGSWNVVSAMAVPVMMGECVGFGVNLVHRWRVDGSVDRAVAGLGRAVFYCATTTVAGFGSLMFAHHRGLSSFGWLMVVGTISALLAALIVLPRLLRLARPPESTVPPDSTAK